jgi:hypothetical protein
MPPVLLMPRLVIGLGLLDLAHGVLFGLGQAFGVDTEEDRDAVAGLLPNHPETDQDAAKKTVSRRPDEESRATLVWPGTAFRSLGEGCFASQRLECRSSRLSCQYLKCVGRPGGA